jgi:glycosyltransferase involved in cell wall biosynthesis
MLELARCLSSRYSLSVVCPPTEGARPIIDGAKQLGLPVLQLEARDDPAALNALGQWLRRNRINVFHSHAGIGWEGLFAAQAAQAAGVPLVVRTEHLPYLLTHPLQQAHHKRVVSELDMVICVSYGVRDSLVGASVPAHKLVVVQNGITPVPCGVDPAQIRAQLHLSPNARIVLTVGRLTEQKGHTYLLEAITQIVNDVPDAHFVWVGDGPLASCLTQRIGELGLAPRITILRKREHVPNLLACADLFVLPSLFEGLPLVALEAMGAGVPIIGTRVCGTDEAVVDRLTGRLVAPKDSDALAGAVIEALIRPDLASEWGKAARERVLASFTSERMARQTARLYDSLAEKRVETVLAQPATLFAEGNLL